MAERIVLNSRPMSREEVKAYFHLQELNGLPVRSKTMTEHTKEPWEDGSPLPWRLADEGYLLDANNRVITGEALLAALPRVIACVNACTLPDGTAIPTEALEGGVIGELVEAVEAILYDPDVENGFAHLGSALAKLKGDAGPGA